MQKQIIVLKDKLDDNDYSWKSIEFQYQLLKREL